MEATNTNICVCFFSAKQFLYIFIFYFLFFSSSFVNSQNNDAPENSTGRISISADEASNRFNITQIEENNGILAFISTEEIYERGILKYDDSDERPRPPLSTLPPNDDTRRRLPRCSMECEDGWIGDLWCDDACNNQQCAFDDGDCKGWCGGECKPGWQNDTQCDLQCYKQECNWDGGACAHLDEIKSLMKNYTWNDTANFDYSQCKCPPNKLGNRKCDSECNNFQCNKDALDCLHDCNNDCPHMWMGDGACDVSCDTEECHFDKGDCTDCAPNCRTWKLGNGICDESCLTPECHDDQGDCQDIAYVLRLDYNATPFEYEFCAFEFIGDGFCDLACNTALGKWDGGDCDHINNPTNKPDGDEIKKDENKKETEDEEEKEEIDEKRNDVKISDENPKRDEDAREAREQEE